MFACTHTDIGTGSRRTNQDTFYISPWMRTGCESQATSTMTTVLAVMDGHGPEGEIISHFVRDNLTKRLEKASYPVSKETGISMCLETERKIKNKRKGQRSGTTALVLFFGQRTDDFQILNCGDCRAVLSRNGLAIQLSRDHKPSKISERIRIESMGGEITEPDNTSFVHRVNGLAVSRAFADFHAGEVITCVPDLFRYKTHPSDEFVILGTDGLWDTIRNEEAVNIIRTARYNFRGKRVNYAQILTQEAMNRPHSEDNITVVVIFFREKGKYSI